MNISDSAGRPSNPARRPSEDYPRSPRERRNQRLRSGFEAWYASGASGGIIRPRDDVEQIADARERIAIVGDDGAPDGHLRTRVPGP
ncbi:hypothetical protein ACWCPQ_33735 [Nocardia sp. NPDC001965]